MAQSIRSKPVVQRFVRVLEPIQVDGSGSIRIQAGKVTEEYQVRTFPAYQGEALGVSLEKADGDIYNVCLGSHDQTNNICSCKGFARHSHCKHFDALTVLNGKGLLPLPIFDFAAAEEELDNADLAMAGGW